MTGATLPDHRTMVRPSRAEPPGVASYLTEFESAATGDELQGPDWLRGLRRAAIERFGAVGFPTSRDEDWRFTSITPVTQRTFRPAGLGRPLRPIDLSGQRYGVAGWTELVFLNGRLTAYASLPPLPAGVKLGGTRRALEVDAPSLQRYLGRHASTGNPFTALNTAMFSDGASLYVPPGAAIESPIHLIFLTDESMVGAVVHPRNLILLGRGARASVIETYASLADVMCWTNPVTEIVLSEGAALEYLRVEQESEQAYHFGTTHIHQERDSRLTSFSVSLGGAIARHNLDVVMNGTGVETHLNGLYMGRGRQLLDNHTSILHAHPNGASREVYKGILDGQAHAVFNGKVYVTPEAQKTDGKQTNRNLLLSDQARVDTKPQLEIFADDVKCTHGATVGRLDETALFYLKSRGIGPALARKILIYAFAAEVLEEIPHEAVRQRLEAEVMSRLDQRGR